MALFYTVPQNHKVVLERFGKFARIQESGLRMRIPILEQIRTVNEWGGIANKRGFLLEMSEQQVDTQPRTCHTRDNVGVTANASVYWAIIDPKRALYEVDVLPVALADIVLNSLRSHVGSMELDEVLTNRKQLNERISADLMETAQKWGVRISRVEIQELSVNDDTSRAMLQQMEAERKRRATIAEAEGQAKAIRMTAEAERDAAIERAKGEAEALTLLAQADAAYLAHISSHAGPEHAAQLLAAQKVLVGYNSISKNPADKVFLPNHFSGVFTLPTENNRSS